MPELNTAVSNAGEPVITDEVLEQAAVWFVRLSSAEVTEADRDDWRAWRVVNNEHERAWQRAELLSRKFAGIPPQLGMASLQATKPVHRRRALRQLAVLFVVGVLGWTGYQQTKWSSEEYLTAIGEIRQITLTDGTRLTLNTASAVEVIFDSRQRTIELRAGEVLVETAADPVSTHRPFSVETLQGRVTALGTRFTVRKQALINDVAVLEGAVEIQPAQAGAQTLRLAAGQAIRFGATHFDLLQSSDAGAAAWARGSLLADNMPLCDFVAEVSRYRTGQLDCDPALADLRISGAFPLADTDRVLTSLASTLPVSISKHSGGGVTVRPR